ncbi:MAG: response regulator transcription factor [Burkholderiales bacterium]|nr:response regulator transcription factor [Nitrosomonas sp.]MCP5274140.1 response regulator transcription factor [Burkholderiales bacterium]
MTPEDFTVYIVDDDAAVRRSLMLMIEQEAIAVKVFDSAEAFLEHYRSQLKGCIIADIHMPGMDGLQLQEILGTRACTMPIIFLTGYGTIPQSVRAIKAGAVDFLTKPITRAKLIACIRSAFAECEKLMQTNQHNRNVQSLLSKLTEREREILEWVVQGLSNKEIASHLGISHRTVEIHRSHIMQKSGATNLLELAQLVNEN